VIIGATPEGKKELVGLADGLRESAQSWRDLLLDLKRRGLSNGPQLAVGDGALGFWKAIEEIWPTTQTQRCWVHKTANVLNKLPNSLHAIGTICTPSIMRSTPMSEFLATKSFSPHKLGLRAWLRRYYLSRAKLLPPRLAEAAKV
jgi:hypothetical protein